VFLDYKVVNCNAYNFLFSFFICHFLLLIVKIVRR
jgi:hypothetical protein